MENKIETFNYNKFKAMHLRRREIMDELLDKGALYMDESSLYNQFENLLNKDVDNDVKLHLNKKSTKFSLISAGLALTGVAASVISAAYGQNPTLFTGLACINTVFFMFDGRSVVRKFKDGRRYKKISRETKFQLGEAANNLAEIEELHIELDEINNNIQQQLDAYYTTTQGLYAKDKNNPNLKEMTGQYHILKAFTNNQLMIPKESEPYYTIEDIKAFNYKDYFNQTEPENE